MNHEPIHYRSDLFIGGPLHGERRAVELSEPVVKVASTFSFNGSDEEVYVKRQFAFQRPDGQAEIVEYWAHDQLRDDQAYAYMWDEIMRALGARVIR